MQQTTAIFLLFLFSTVYLYEGNNHNIHGSNYNNKTYNTYKKHVTI